MKYRTIVADPPWPLKWKMSPGVADRVMPDHDWMLAQGTVGFRNEERRHRSRGFWDDLGAETLREHRHEPDTGNPDDGLSMRDRDLYARELALDEQPKEDA